MPYYPLEDSEGHHYETPTYWDHIVMKYTGLDILQVQQLDYIDYLLYRRDAFITTMSQTEKGREYLNNAYRIEQVEPDRGELRKNFGKE